MHTHTGTNIYTDLELHTHIHKFLERHIGIQTYHGDTHTHTHTTLPPSKETRYSYLKSCEKVKNIISIFNTLYQACLEAKGGRPRANQCSGIQ